MNDDYDDLPRNPMGYCVITLVFGLIGLVIVFALPEQSIISVILGGVGMVAGGFAIGLSNHHPIQSERTKFVLMSGVGILLSVMAFMYGLVKWVG